MSRRMLVAAAAVCVLVSTTGAASASPGRDALRAHQWGLDQGHADQAWKVPRGAGVVVAVIDTGVDLGHPDLKGALLPGKDFTGGGSVADDCGHGTEVTGVIAA